MEAQSPTEGVSGYLGLGGQGRGVHAGHLEGCVHLRKGEKIPCGWQRNSVGGDQVQWAQGGWTAQGGQMSAAFQSRSLFQAAAFGVFE